MHRNPTPVLVVALALIAPDGRICLQRRPAEKMHGNLWEFPGGKVNAGESVELALCREIAEELGVQIEPADLMPCGFATDAGADGRSGLVILLHACRQWRGEPAALEGGMIGWFAPEDLAARPMPPLDYPLAEQVRKLVTGGVI